MDTIAGLDTGNVSISPDQNEVYSLCSIPCKGAHPSPRKGAHLKVRSNKASKPRSYACYV